jgi:hypothetical protein
LGPQENSLYYVLRNIVEVFLYELKWWRVVLEHLTLPIAIGTGGPIVIGKDHALLGPQEDSLYYVLRNIVEVFL